MIPTKLSSVVMVVCGVFAVSWALGQANDEEQPEVRIVDGDGNVLYEGDPADMPAALAARLGMGDDYEPFEDDAYPDGGGPSVTSLEGSIMPLVEHFNQQHEAKRFMGLVSATCPACIHGARSVRDSILKAYPDGAFSVSIVWIDMLPGDGAKAVARSARLFNDPRVMQFYDEDGRVGELFSGLLLKQDAGPAWDMYMFFDMETTWGAAPPTPSEWYHQLSGARRADTSLFRTGEALVNQLRESAGRWLGVARVAPQAVPGLNVKQAKVKHELELLYIEGCPNHAILRERLTRSLDRCRLECSIVEVDLATLSDSDARRRFGSPSILYGGADLFGQMPSASGALSCRVYAGGSCPTVDELCEALCRSVCTSNGEACCANGDAR